MKKTSPRVALRYRGRAELRWHLEEQCLMLQVSGCCMAREHTVLFSAKLEAHFSAWPM